MENKHEAVKKADLYDALEKKFYGDCSYIIISKEWVAQFIEGFFVLITKALEEGHNVELHDFGSFKVKLDKNAVVRNTVVFVSSKSINDNAVDSRDETITEKDLIKLMTDHFFKSDEESLRFPRRSLVEAIVVLIDSVKDALIKGQKVSILGIGTLYVETDECYSSKIHRTRMRTRALLEPAKELVESVN